jgi:hypothetical protein
MSEVRNMDCGSIDRASGFWWARYGVHWTVLEVQARADGLVLHAPGSRCVQDPPDEWGLHLGTEPVAAKCGPVDRDEIDEISIILDDAIGAADWSQAGHARDLLDDLVANTECRSVAVVPSMLDQIKSEVGWGSEPEVVAKRLDNMIRNMTWGNTPENWPAERKMAVWACWWELMGYSAGMVHVTLPELVAIASRVPATEQESIADDEAVARVVAICERLCLPHYAEAARQIGRIRHAIETEEKSVPAASIRARVDLDALEVEEQEMCAAAMDSQSKESE